MSGSLLNVAGGRCTDGVWMTMQIDSKCLYVLMELEGLGIFERTEQEYMLLLVLNASLTNVTIFNKTIYFVNGLICLVLLVWFSHTLVVSDISFKFS